MKKVKLGKTGLEVSAVALGDKVEILSGIFEGKTTGTPISMVVHNKDHHSTTPNALPWDSPQVVILKMFP